VSERSNRKPATAASTSRPRVRRVDDRQVSSNSRFSDHVWDFSKENQNPAASGHDKQIFWSFTMPDGGLFTDARFRYLLVASKQFIYAVRWNPVDGPALAPATLRNLFKALKRFIIYLTSCPNPILRFKDVLPHHCEDYIRDLVSSDTSRSAKYRSAQLMQKLHQYRGVMTDGLMIDPLSGEAASYIAGKDPCAFQSKTEIIPEETLGQLVRTSLQYVENFAPYLLEMSDKVEAVRKRSGPIQVQYFGTRSLRQHGLEPYQLTGTRLEKGVRSLRQLSTELSYLQTACFVLIAFATGMRLSELLSMRSGCCQIETSPEQPDLIWLHSRVFKMQGVPDGRETKWLGGPVCAKAVLVLERLGSNVRRHARAPYLWMPIPSTHGRYRTSTPLLQPTILRRLRLYVTMLGLKNSKGQTYHIHPHMFRRTFARYVVRYDTTNLLALKEHFKHISLSMTDYYVGSDLELWTLMEEETERVSIESFDKALRAEQLAGPGGVRLRKKVNAAIAEGRLEKEFRGEAGAHLRKRMIIDLVEAGQRIYPCASSNYCWFHVESALCTDGDRPVLKHCNPGACSNSIITVEHKPHWERVRNDCEALMQDRPQALPYQKALRDIHAVSGAILRSLK
jgi:integrase